ncbi:MAG: hypothetical protein NC213_08505 [Acetobacter sp.]|nr:hypothetical protein [Bacteroides sp.]MCM1341769.1 hypothetical protein [Acetobacter sp.]MCM1433112.1 hypothetical protein [Clostridiales bacterium]
MKKLLSVVMAVAVMASVTVSFSACSKKEYKDTVVVTDEDGKQVTDKDGKPVTEVVSTTEGNSKNESTSKNASSAVSEKDTTEKSTKNNSKTTEKKTDKKDTTKKENMSEEKTTKKNTTTKPSTTAKPKKRAVTVTVKLPYYNNETHDMSVWYKLPGDKEYIEGETKEVVLDGSEHIVDLGKLKGDVKVIVRIDGIKSLSQNTGTILADEDNIFIRLATGIEMMDGGLD